jgi:hypothetical protein
MDPLQTKSWIQLLKVARPHSELEWAKVLDLWGSLTALNTPKDWSF